MAPEASHRSVRFARVRSIRVVGLVLVGVIALAAVPGSAAGAAEPDTGRDPRIIGGTVAPAGSWPSQAALLRAGEPDRWAAQFCGGTVIDPAWVLTAAHCVSGEDGDPVRAGSVDVLVGTHDLTHGGTRIRVEKIVIRPGWNSFTLIHDMALLQLTRPAPVPRGLVVAGSADTPPPGTELALAGWGQSDAPGIPFPTQLRQVTVPSISGSDCADLLQEASETWYPGAPAYHDTHLCTGPIGSGGRGPCYGDSGGPLVWEAGGRRVLVGIVSWGLFCGGPESPSVFARVASGANWIRATIRYGPHVDEPDFAFYIGSNFLLPEWSASAPDPESYVVQTMALPVVENRDAAIVRLYDAVFDRGADQWGFDYWRSRMTPFYFSAEGASITRVAEVMTRSSEFQATYGSLNDSQFVDQIYVNVLGRPADAGGKAFWTGRLAAGATRGAVVAGISESRENRARTRGDVDAQVAFLVLIHRPPDPGERAKWSARPLEDVVHFLLHSYAYANTVDSIFLF